MQNHLNEEQHICYALGSWNKVQETVSDFFLSFAELFKDYKCCYVYLEYIFGANFEYNELHNALKKQVHALNALKNNIT